ncbi:cation transporter [Zhongshania aliphaticivorans]|uniref:cation transporter n=1 Tax=Zhongshania aliphaticivorans TaxID=1470434 RepID=UPI0039C92470
MSDNCQKTLQSTRDGAEASYVSEFHVPGMDCPSEESMIRMSLAALEPSVALKFDTPNRKVFVFHEENLEAIEERMVALGFGASLTRTEAMTHGGLTEARAKAEQEAKQEAGVLRWLLAINAVMFVIEITVGWWAQSTGLIADSLDMFADAAVYGMALYATGRSASMKLRAAHLSGWLQLLLALGALSEVIRRFLVGSEPASTMMMGIGLVALVANTVCLLLIAKNRDGGVHMKASWIFSANDVIANIGVILAGGLVALTGSHYPDLVIGLIIAVIVLIGARRILRLRA